MTTTLSTGTRRTLNRILPFPVIWVLTGWVFMLVEQVAIGGYDSNADTAIKLDLPVILFAAAAMAVVGLLIGLIELVYLERVFRNKSFLAKTIYKLLLYILLMLLIIGVTYPVAASLELKLPLWSAAVWDKFLKFLGSPVFFSPLLQPGFACY